jgi:hypothetical protein
VERPIGYPEALRVLHSWLGERVHVKVSNRQGAEITSIEGVLSKDSTGDREVFGVDEPGDPSATVPVALEEPYACILGDGDVTVATTAGMVVKFSFAGSSSRTAAGKRFERGERVGGETQRR